MGAAWQSDSRGRTSIRRHATRLYLSYCGDPAKLSVDGASLTGGHSWRHVQFIQSFLISGEKENAPLL